MALAGGTRLGPYQVLGPIGAGGMGEVYRAKDTRLDRTVAIKVLPAEVSGDPDRRARFEREAKSIAALTHSNICTLHDIGEHAGAIFLVMEHLEGETLAHRLEKGGALPIQSALMIATDIADALSAAHRRGIIHRDLKPGNVMLTKTGAKLLDFGLAKLTGHGEQPAAGHLVSVPTRSAPLTGEGVILGTLQYMAPEQIEGKPVDARTDLWALGAVIYEMVSGKRAFEATSAASLIGAILERQPAPLAALQPLTPPAIDRLARRCLAKAPDDRPDTAHDLADQLRAIRESVEAPAGPQADPRARFRFLAAAATGGIALAAALVGAGAMWFLRAPVDAEPAPVVRAELGVQPANELDRGGIAGWSLTPGGSRTAFAWTPTGDALVFVGRHSDIRQLFVRSLNREAAVPLTGTEGAQSPAVSVDGQWVAFWAGGALKKTPIAGGPTVQILSGQPPPARIVWDARGRLYFDASGVIWRVDGSGAPVQVTTRIENESHVLPFLLPREDVLIFTARRRRFTTGDEEIVAHTLATGERKVVLRDASDARYVSTGHLVFLRRGVLWTVPFDAETVQLRGTEVALIDGVAQATTGGSIAEISHAGQFAISATGALAWLRGPLVPPPPGTLVAVDRRGHVSALTAPGRSHGHRVRLSPNGNELVVNVTGAQEIGLWRHDLARGTLTPILQQGEAVFPLWTPEGRHIVFSWFKDGRYALAKAPVDGSAPPEVLVPEEIEPFSWASGGRELVARRSREMVVVNLEQARPTAKPLAGLPTDASSPTMSRDGRWLAYSSADSGREEVYVQPYPGRGGRTQVSLNGGSAPAWAADSRRLFFVSESVADQDRDMMEVDLQLEPALRVGAARVLFPIPADLSFNPYSLRGYDVAPDGQRFYVVRTSAPPAPPTVTHINLVQNWFEELKAKAPAR